MATTGIRSRHMRRWRLAFAAAVLVPVTCGLVMTGQHGYAFFIFRSAGTGQTANFPGSRALAENQGPGQPDAPGQAVAARKPAAVPHAAVPPVSPVMTLTTGPGAGTVITTRSAVTGPVWAGLAQRRDGQWAVLAVGGSYASVLSATQAGWNRHAAQYASAWLVIPLAGDAP